jgi:Protein of unknown function (DUF4238)
MAHGHEAKNDPLYHHYVPRSFFKPWADSSQWIIVYERKNGTVLRPYRASTKSICVQKGLYSYTDEVGEQQRNAIEQRLLSLVDNHGACVLQKLYLQDGEVMLSKQERYYFAAFLNSLRIRTPEAFAHYAVKAETLLRDRLSQDDPRLDEKDLAEVLNGQTLLEWVERNNAKILKNFGHQLLAKFMIDDEFVNRVMNMHWLVLKRVAYEINFLTSDRPLVLIGNAANQNFGFAIAISTDRVFLATSNRPSISNVLNLQPKTFIQQMNISTVQQAKNKAFAVNKTHAPNFFQSHLSVHHKILPWVTS